MQRLRRWIAANPLAAVSLAGVVLYGILRLANGLFYGRLGLTPEEVGVGYQETLAQWALYLGQSGGTTFLYIADSDGDAGQALRIPSSLIAVAVPSARDACDRP